MSAISKTVCEIEIVEIEGKDQLMIDGPKLLIRSHWNYDGLVELELDGKRFAVSAATLTDAIRRCSK